MTSDRVHHGALGEVLPGVYRHTSSAHVYVVRDGDAAVLVNIGDGSVLDDLPSGVRTVRAVLLTHNHRDVAAGASRAVRAGIPVYAPEGERDRLTDPSRYYALADVRNNYDARAHLWTVPEAAATLPLREYRTYRFGRLRFTVRPTPGPTPGSVSYLTSVQRRRVAFTGDLLYAPGQVTRLASTQWTYHGGEGIAGTILSLLDLAEQHPSRLLPAHGEVMRASALHETAEALWSLLLLRRHNVRLLQWRNEPYETLRPWLLRNRTSLANAYVLRARNGHALMIDFGYDFCFGQASSTERESRRPWLYTIPRLMTQYGVTQIDAVIPTHYHDDHVAGIPLLREVYGAQLWTPENITDVLAQPDAYRLPCLWFERLPPTRVLRTGETIEWEEFRITPYELPGHTRFAAALLVETNGERVLFGGDQYADADALGMPYTYLNLFRETDYVASARLMRTLRPDLILMGHTLPFAPGDAYYAAIEARGAELESLHARLQPHSSRLILTATPIHVSSGAPVTLTIENPTLREFRGELLTYGRALEASRAAVSVPARSHVTLVFSPSGPPGARAHFELRGAPGDPALFAHATIQHPATGGFHDE